MRDQVLGYNFSPPSRDYTPLGYDQHNQDFVATGIGEQISPNNFQLNFDATLGRSVHIRYEFAASWINLSIYDVSGKRVATLVDGEKPAGRYECSWIPDATGIYLCRFISQGKVLSQKVILLH